MTIAELAENHGTLDLLTAYIMGTANVSEEQAAEWVYEIDFALERMLDERVSDKLRSFKCKECGEAFIFDADDFDGDGGFHPDGEEMLWGHIQLDHPSWFEEVCDLETPYMIEECYDEEE